MSQLVSFLQIRHIRQIRRHSDGLRLRQRLNPLQPQTAHEVAEILGF